LSNLLVSRPTPAERSPERREALLVEARLFLQHVGMNSSALSTPMSDAQALRERRRPTAGQAGWGASAPVVAPAWEQIDQALARPYSKLAFDAELEARFEADSLPDRIHVMGRAAQWTPPAIGLMLFADQFMIPDVWTMAVVARLLAMAPYSLVIHLFRRQMGSPRMLEVVGLIGLLASAAVHLALVSQSQSDLAVLHVGATSMLVMFGAAVLRLRFFHALLGISLIDVAAMLTYAFMPNPHKELVVGVPAMLLLLSASAFSLYASFHLEKEERRNFLLSLKQALIRDDLRQTIGQVESMARVDPLTQLTNRRYFDQQIERLWSRLQIDTAPVSVLLIKIDHFDAFGHKHGARKADACLHELAQAVQSCLRRPNDLVARAGHDEFVVVLSHTGSEPAHIVAQRVLQAAHHLGVGSQGVSGFGVTVSIGVASLRGVCEFDSVQALETMARHSLASARKQGGDRMVQSWSERPVA
jgi:diguanylate cyclase (GGDEF)-like protein